MFVSVCARVSECVCFSEFFLSNKSVVGEVAADFDDLCVLVAVSSSRTPPVCVVQLLCACILIGRRNLTNKTTELNKANNHVI